MTKASKAAVFNAEQQARYDALVSKYWNIFQESADINKKANEMMKPYKGKNALPQTGETFFKVASEAAKLQAKAKKMSKDAQCKVDAEFWN